MNVASLVISPEHRTLPQVRTTVSNPAFAAMPIDSHMETELDRASREQQEIIMKNVVYIAAVAMSLFSGVNLAMAQSTPGNGITTGSAANSEAKYHDGEYTHDRTYGGGLPLYGSRLMNEGGRSFARYRGETRHLFRARRHAR